MKISTALAGSVLVTGLSFLVSVSYAENTYKENLLKEIKEHDCILRYYGLKHSTFMKVMFQQKITYYNSIRGNLPYFRMMHQKCK